MKIKEVGERKKIFALCLLQINKHSFKASVEIFFFPPTGIFSVSVGHQMACADGTISIAIQVQIGATAPMALAIEVQPIPQQSKLAPLNRRFRPHRPGGF